jgi:hypothetical protein
LLSLSPLIKGPPTSGGDIMKALPWIILAAIAFLISFYSATVMMDVIYPLDQALLSF